MRNWLHPSRNRSELRNDALRLVRIRLTCMDPNKKNWPGEIFTVANAVVGTVKKYVPFHDTDEGYHVPHIIYKHLKGRQYQEFKKVRLPNGRTKTETYLAKAFAIQKLPPLTPEEMKDLAQRQALNHSIDR